jgi:hypothetical protein
MPSGTKITDGNPAIPRHEFGGHDVKKKISTDDRFIIVWSFVCKYGKTFRLLAGRCRNSDCCVRT